MEPRWQTLGRTVATTFVITTIFWFCVAAWWYARNVSQPGSTVPNAKIATDTSRPSGNGGLLIPVAAVRFSQLSDTFAQARAGGARRHDALDIMAPRGATVIAAAPGRVEKLFQSHDGGNTIYVRSPDRRRIYYYAHLDGYAPALAEGTDVRAGQALGTVGTTGNASPDAPHLHFAIWQVSASGHWYDQGTAINPYDLLRP